MAQTVENLANMSTSAPAPHPLEPLSIDEIRTAVEIIRADVNFSPSARFVSLALNEPAKTVVLSHLSGDRVDREAFAVLLDNESGHCVEVVASLARQTVVARTVIKGVQPAISPDEIAECGAAVKRSPEFVEALRKRGVTDPNLAMVDPWSAGAYETDLPSDEGRRLVRALISVRSEPGDNGYARPVEGLLAIVDLNRMEVVRIEDHGVVPLPPESGNWSRRYIDETREAPKSLEIVQEDGPSFTVDGHEIRWQNWRFRIGFTPREGLILHTVGYEDEGQLRPIIYRASLSEMVVPYGDPKVTSYRKNAFDIGEYGIGQIANSLKLDCDCLGEIRYFDAHMVDSKGNATTIENAVCLHEEDSGILWKHTDFRNGDVEVRRSRRLVVSFITTVGIYDYGFYWNFYQDGSLEFEAKLTGIPSAIAHMPGYKPKHGTLVAPQLNASYHQHIFNARLDMNLEGQTNSVYEINVKPTPLGDENPHGNAFAAEHTLLKREQGAQRLCNMPSSRYWKVVNESVRNRLDEPVGYRLVPGENAVPFASDDASVIKRAGFLKKHVWVTPYRDDEKYAAGDYPNQRATGDGLPQWTSADRSIQDTDLVVWYTFGHTHIPRPEEWPVMPVHRIGFMLKPDGFFHRNPALDVPPSDRHLDADHRGY